MGPPVPKEDLRPLVDGGKSLRPAGTALFPVVERGRNPHSGSRRRERIRHGAEIEMLGGVFMLFPTGPEKKPPTVRMTPEGAVDGPAIGLQGERSVEFIRTHRIRVPPHEGHHAVVPIFPVVGRHIDHPARVRGMQFRRPQFPRKLSARRPPPHLDRLPPRQFSQTRRASHADGIVGAVAMTVEELAVVPQHPRVSAGLQEGKTAGENLPIAQARIPRTSASCSSLPT